MALTLPDNYEIDVLDHIKNSPNDLASDGGIPTTGPPAHELRLSAPNELARYSGWDVDFRQIEPGEMDTRVTVRPSRNVTLLEIHMDRAVHQQGCSPSDTVTLGLPLSPALRSWQGAAMESAGLLYFGTATEFDGVSGPGFEGLTVSILEPFLAQLADRTGLPLQDGFQGRRSQPIRRRSAALRRMAESGRSLLYGCGTRFGELEQEDFVAGLISAAADAEKFDDRSALSTRARSVRHALDYLADRAGDEISVGSICAATGVSWRTLDRGFREQFGIGPKAYLNRFRLGLVRSELLRKRADTGVADAANAWGFWHMGQFAKDYYRMFGELPSETLKTRAR